MPLIELPRGIMNDNTMNKNESNNLQIFSFFAGVGFLDLGFENAGFPIMFVNEFIPSFLETYKYTRSKMNINEPEYGYHLGDITSLTNGNSEVNLKDFIKHSKKQKNFVGFIAGPPCPDFSVGGKNRGRKGERGQLSQTYINIIKQQQPDFFLFENVKGLWRTKKHREFFEELKKQLHEVGYVTDEKLVNSIEFGVPQDRDRIILLGFKKEILNEISVPFDQKTMTLAPNTFPWYKYAKYNKEDTLSLPWPQTNEFTDGKALPIPEGIIEELTIEYWFKKNDVMNHPNSSHAFTPRAGLTKFLAIQEGDVSKKSYKRLHRWRYSPTAAYGNNEVHIHPYFPRRISAAEALSIQSLPKEFVFPESMTLTDMFKTIGNGVPYLLSYSIARSIRDFLK